MTARPEVSDMDAQALVATVERLEAEHQRLSAESARQAARIAAIFDVMREAARITGQRIDVPLKLVEGSSDSGRSAGRPNLIVVGGVR